MEFSPPELLPDGRTRVTHSKSGITATGDTYAEAKGKAARLVKAGQVKPGTVETLYDKAGRRFLRASPEKKMKTLNWERIETAADASLDWNERAELFELTALLAFQQSPERVLTPEELTANAEAVREIRQQVKELAKRSKKLLDAMKPFCDPEDEEYKLVEYWAQQTGGPGSGPAAAFDKRAIFYLWVVWRRAREHAGKDGSLERGCWRPNRSGEFRGPLLDMVRELCRQFGMIPPSGRQIEHAIVPTK